MQDTQQILAYSFVIVLAVAWIVASKGLISAYGSSLSDKDFAYKFDKTRVPIAVYTVSVLLIVSFVYGLIISGELGTATGFSLLTTAFGGLGFMLGICFVPQNKK
jgi:hypothetical protein